MSAPDSASAFVADAGPVNAMQSSTALPTRAVLVVDDFPAVLAWAARSFLKAGWLVRVATDGDEAMVEWTAARQAGVPITLLVTDLGLPGLDGAELLRRLREDDPSLPALVLHGGEAAPESWNGRLPDRTALFEKPLHAAQLLANAEALVRTCDELLAQADSHACDDEARSPVSGKSDAAHDGDPRRDGHIVRRDHGATIARASGT